MNATERQAFADALTMARAYWKQPTSDFVLDVWWQACQPFELRAVKAALAKRAVSEWGFRAPIASDVVQVIMGTSGDPAAMAWGKVIRRAWRQRLSVRVSDGAAVHAAIEDISA